MRPSDSQAEPRSQLSNPEGRQSSPGKTSDSQWQSRYVYPDVTAHYMIYIEV